MFSLSKYSVILLIFFALAAFAKDGDTDPFYLTGSSYGGVRDMEMQPDGKLLIVGEFQSVVGFPTRRIARLKANGDLDVSFNTGIGANNVIYAISLQPDGKIVIGGAFTTYNGLPANRVARLNPDGSLDPTFNDGTGPNAGVFSLALTADNKILVGGNFSSFNGIGIRGIVRLNSDGSVDSSFNSSNTTPVTVLSIVIQPDQKILIGGAFTLIGGQVRNRFARLNSDGTVDQTFPVGGGASSTVNAIELLANGKILVGGTFGQFNGANQAGIARLNSDGSLDTKFSTSGINSVTAIGIQPDGKIFLGGQFPNPPNGDRGTRRLHADGSNDTSLTTTETGSSPVYSVRFAPDGKVLLLGSFTAAPLTIGGAANPGVIKLTDDGSRDGSFITRNGASGGFGNMIVEPLTGRIVVSGGASIGGLQNSGIARLLPDGTRDHGFQTTVIGSGLAIQPDGKYVVGGVFTNINGIYRFYRVNQDGTTDSSYSADSGPNPVGSSNIYRIEAQADGKILAIGTFNAINSVARKGFARLNTDGSLDTSFNPIYDGYEWDIRGLAIQPDGKILICGRFNTVGPGGGPIVSYLVRRFNSNGTSDDSFTTVSLNHIPYVVGLQKNTGKIFIGGFFDTVNGVASKRVGLLYSNGTVDQNFHPPELAGFGGGGGIVEELIPQKNGKLVIGGQFVTINGAIQRLIARLNPDGSFDSFFRPSLEEINPFILALAQQPDGKLLVSSDPPNFNNSPISGSIRLLNTNKAAPFDYDGDGRTDISIFRPSTGVWFVQKSSDSNFSINQWGTKGDRTVPADYDGDGKVDLAVWRPSNGVWFWINSSNGTLGGNQFGLSGDIPSPGDYDGDGKADIMIYRQSAGQWWIYRSSDSNVSITFFGIAEDKPAAGDFDGDGITDVSLFRPSNATWYRLNSGNGTFVANQFGLSGDNVAQADYDGDGKTDVAIWRPSNGAWYWMNSSSGTTSGVLFGLSEDKPAPGDYDGDGKCDPAVFRPSQATWYMLRSTQGFTAQQFGATGDIPTPNSFIY